MNSRNNQSWKTAGAVPQELPDLRRRVSELLDQFLAEPAGEAREIVELYLVTYLASEQGRYEERALGEANESRRRAQAVRREAARLRRERHNLADDNQRLEAEVAQAQAARRALDHEFRIIEVAVKKKEITQLDIVRRISAAIGMGGPLVERIEPGYEESRG